MEKFRIFLLLLFLFTTFLVQAQKGCEIVVELDHYTEKEVRLAYYLGDQLYVKDTLSVNKKGKFVYKNKNRLQPGSYAIVLSPDNKGMEFLVNGTDQHFSIHADIDSLFTTMRYKGSKDNNLFSDYVQLINEMRPLADSLNKIVQTRKEAGESVSSFEQELKAINEKVEEYKTDVLQKHPKTLTASIIRSQDKIVFPEFEGTDEEIGFKQYLYRRDHYFDAIRTDTAFFRLKTFYGMVNYYMEKLIVPHPDSTMKGVDEVLGMIESDEALFRLYFIRFINKYGKMQMIGHDAIYVHLVENYCLKGRTPFLPKEELDKAIAAVEKTKPLLIGETVPNIDMKELDIEGTIKLKDQENEHQRFKVNKIIPLYGVDSPYTVLFFWKHDCSACKKAMPKMVEFYEKYKEKGVEVYAVPTKTYKDMPACAEFLNERNATEWINAVDPYFQTKFMNIYHLESTPRIYILNDKKEIIMNRIGAEQIGKVMDGILK